MCWLISISSLQVRSLRIKTDIISWLSWIQFSNRGHHSSQGIHHDVNIRVVVRATKKYKHDKREEPGGACEAAEAGYGMSPTTSFKKDPNLEALVKIWISARMDLISSDVTTATWNQEESDLQSRGPPWSPWNTRTEEQVNAVRLITFGTYVYGSTLINWHGSAAF